MKNRCAGGFSWGSGDLRWWETRSAGHDQVISSLSLFLCLNPLLLDSFIIFPSAPCVFSNTIVTHSLHFRHLLRIWQSETSDNVKKNCRSHTVWLIFIKCSNTTEITAHGEVKYQRASSSRRLAFQQESLRKDAVKLEGKEQSDKQTSSANPFDSGELALCETGKNGSSNYQRTQWDCFLHAGWHFDLRGNNESNQKLMPALPLGSQPIRGMFTHRLWGPPCFCLASCPLSGSVTVTMIKRRQTACERSY